MKLKTFISIIALVLLAGCGAQTTGKYVEINNRFNFENCRDVSIDPDVATKSGDQKLDVEAPKNFDTKLDTLIDWLEKTTTLDSFNKVENAMKDLPSSTAEHTENSVTFNDLRLENGRMFRWMKLTGADYGTPLTFKFGEYTMVVDDPSHDYNGKSPRDPTQGVWFCGKEIEACKMPDCAASVFGPTDYTGAEVIVSW